MKLAIALSNRSLERNIDVHLRTLASLEFKKLLKSIGLELEPRQRKLGKVLSSNAQHPAVKIFFFKKGFSLIINGRIEKLDLNEPNGIWQR